MDQLLSKASKLGKNLLHRDRHNSNMGKILSTARKLKNQLDRLRLVVTSRHRHNVRLPAEIWHLILTEYLDKSGDILRFALAHGSDYKCFDSYLYRSNVLYGGCSGLAWAATRGNWKVVEELLQVPEMEMFVPETIWQTVLEAVQAQDNTELARLLFAKQTVQTRIAAAADEVRRGWDLLNEYNTPLEDENLWLKPMFDAARKGQLDIIKLYLCHVSADLPDALGTTVLGTAAYHGHTFIVKFLKEEHNADPDPVNRPIELAAKKGRSEVVELLLSYGVDPRFHGFPFSRAFILAISDGRENVVEVLLKDSRVDPNNGGFGGEAPLLLACSSYGRQNLTVFEMLLKDERVDVTALDGSGRNACTLAAMCRNHRLLELILDDGRIDPNVSDDCGNTPVMYATFRKSQLGLLMEDERVDLEKKNDDGETVLHRLARVGDEEGVGQLLNSRRLNADQARDDGNTPLSLACSQGRFSVVKLLLATCRVDLAKRNNKGKTPLMLAIEGVWGENSDVEAIVKMLLDSGEDLLDLSIVQYAAKWNQTNILEMFLAKKAKYAEFFDDRTPVYSSTRKVLIKYQKKLEKDKERERKQREKQIKREERQVKYDKLQAMISEKADGILVKAAGVGRYS